MKHRTITINVSALLRWLLGIGLFAATVFALWFAMYVVIARLTPEVNPVERFTEVFRRWVGTALFVISVIPAATLSLLFYIARRLAKIQKLLESKTKES